MRLLSYYVEAKKFDSCENVSRTVFPLPYSEWKCWST